MLDPIKIKKDFPIFNRKISDKEIVYLDNGATTHKPTMVIDAITDFYQNHNSNVHRGIYALSEEATDMYENARKDVATFISANVPQEIVFTSGATQSINMIAYGFFLPRIESTHTIITTRMEHHSNLVPWQQIAKAKGATLKVIDFEPDGSISLDKLREALDTSVKVVALTHVSNVLGSILPIKRIASMVHKIGAKLVVDGSQAVPHMPVNMKSLACDFYTFSGHKMLGPMGTGVLYGKREYLDAMNPITFGGGMINKVDLTDATWAPSPEKFEAGTPNVAGAVGLASATKYLKEIGMDNIQEHEESLISYTMDKFGEIPDLHILGTQNPKERTGIVSFYIESVHSHDIAAVLSTHNVCVRSGHHCTMPLHKALEINSSTRASFYIYNTKSDVDALVNGIMGALKILK